MNTHIPTLKNNYAILFHLYRRGWFEQKKLEVPGFGKYVYLNSRYDHELRHDGSSRPPITYAADDLYEVAHFLQENHKRDKIPTLVWQAMTLAYEINDVYLRVPREQVDFFSRRAREIAASNKEDAEGVAEDIAERLHNDSKTYADRLEDPQEIVKYKKLKVLAALAGVNAILRETKSSDRADRRADVSKAEVAVGYATNLLSYIKLKLPGEHTSIPDPDRPGCFMPERESYGLLGLCHFERGRALLLLGGRYREAEESFVLSTQAYADRLSQKEAFWQADILKIDQAIERVEHDELMSPGEKAEEIARLTDKKAKHTEKCVDRKSVTLRRMALTTAIGSSFLAFTRSQLTRALEGLTLARTVLRENSSTVLRAYVEMLYLQIQRAQHSDRLDVLTRAKEGLEDCYKVFCELTPDRHYQHRCALEFSLVCFYLSQADPDNKDAYFSEAFEKIHQAEAYFLDKDKSARHRHLHSELCILKSHLMRHCPRRNLVGALETAETALGHAVSLRQYKCEALLALAAAHASLAREHYERSAGGKNRAEVERYEWHAREVRANIGLALSTNADNNPRVKAVSYLRLAKLCLIEPEERHREAQHHFESWLGVRDLVEHKFCHVHAAQVEEALSHGPRRLVIDFTKENVKKADWEKAVETLFIDTCLHHVSEKITRDDQLKENKKEHKGEVVAFLQEAGLRKPYDYINEYKLMDKLGRILGVDYTEVDKPPGRKSRRRRR